MTARTPPNALTIDVEEYFQVSAFEDVVDRDGWASRESRVEASTDLLLDLLGRAGARATFFVLGWIAERHPDLVRRIRDAGHEIASHGWDHRRVDALDAATFREDLRRAGAAIAGAAGVEVEGYRAPSFSVSRATPWAHAVLAEEGFRYSSSVFPVRHDRYGVPDFPRHPVRLRFPDGRAVWEFPLTTWRVWGTNLPAAGGGWLRALPPFVVHRGIARANADGWPAVVYLHPWELDPGQPEVPGARRLARFRHRLNLGRTRARLEGLLDRFAFVPMAEALERLPARDPLGAVAEATAWATSG
jgi:polysaccharide deacetylase family protein (PEP-CTERM system associated)